LARLQGVFQKMALVPAHIALQTLNYCSALVIYAATGLGLIHNVTSAS
jgi:hypothetical protein